ncbi:unnamed protein product, partial [marine sediment metagenome]
RQHQTNLKQKAEKNTLLLKEFFKGFRYVISHKKILLTSVVQA